MLKAYLRLAYNLKHVKISDQVSLESRELEHSPIIEHIGSNSSMMRNSVNLNTEILRALLENTKLLVRSTVAYTGSKV